MATWQGPILPPAILKQYDDIIPNGAERLFKQFEAESLHRRDLEKRGMQLQGRDLIFGKIAALLFVLATLATVAFAIHKDSPWVAGTLGGAMLVMIATGFFRIYGDSQSAAANEKSASKNEVPKGNRENSGR